MSILTVILLLVLGAMNMVMYKVGEKQSIDIMHSIANNDGNMLRRPPEMLPRKFDSPIRKTTTMCVLLDNQNNIKEVIVENQSSYDADKAASLVTSALKNNNKTGTLGNLRYLLEDKPYGKIMVFMDNSAESENSSRLIFTSFVIGGISVIIVFFVAMCLSRWAIKPVKKSWEKQKQFVADASHELKTPLTVINANIDVLTSDSNNNKWLGYIKEETKRMNLLVNNLLYLAKSDIKENSSPFSQFDLSQAVKSSVLPFESIIYEANKKLHLRIEEGIFYYGDEHAIKRVVIALLDNAVKNCKASGRIDVSLITSGNKKILIVYNTGDSIPDNEKDRIFERFYRVDTSRVREEGGYGLGLSIVKSILDAHKGKIMVESPSEGGVKFIVSL